MTNILTPDALPASTATFIAYGAEVRLNDPVTDKPITLRPQTFVQYYKTITISKIGSGRNGNARVVRVEFDPTSIGFSEPIGANLDPDDPLVEYLREQHTAGNPVDVAIETIRKVKNKVEKPISPLAHIHALRGADHPSGTHANMNRTGENTRKMLVMANGRPGKALTSNAAEWRMLVSNKEGNLPPEGWSFYNPSEDWQGISVVVPDTENPARNSSNGNGGGASGIDPGALGTLIEKVMHHVLDQRAGGVTKGAHNFGGKFTEGMPWDARTSDGQVNLGSYGVSHVGEAYRFAHSHLDDVTESHTAQETWDLAILIGSITDEVQVGAYRGQNLVANRMAKSWDSAFEWVTWIIQSGYAYPNADNTDEWAATVRDMATRHLAQAGHLAGEWFKASAEAKKMGAATPAQAQAKKQEQQQAQAQNAQASAAAPQAAAPEAPDADVVNRMLAATVKAWSDAAGLRVVHGAAAEKGLLGTVVAYRDLDSTPAFAFPAPEGAPTGPIGALIEARGRAIAAAAEPKQDTAPAETAPATQEDPAPAPAQDAPKQEQAPATAPEQAPAQAPQPMSPAVIAVMKALNENVSSTDELRAVYEQAKSTNVLGQQVPVRLDGTKVHYDAAAPAKSVADVLSHLRTAYEAAAPAAPAAAAPSESVTHSDSAAPQAGAQALADQAATATTKDELVMVREKAIADGVLEDTVSVGGNSGVLRAYLDVRVKQVA